MKDISHKGRVVAVDSRVTTVEFTRSEACAGCRARMLCGTGDSGKTSVQVDTDAFSPHYEGDEVEVCIKASMGAKALWLCYVVPLAVLLAAIGLSALAAMPELLSGLTAIGAVALYYAVIYCFRKRLNNEFVFYLK